MHHHDHEHHHSGLIARLIGLFKHNHAHAEGRLETGGLAGFASPDASLEHDGKGAGALAVEGPDDVGHGVDTVTGLAKKVAHGDEQNPQSFGEGLQYLGIPHTHAAADASIALGAVLTPLGLYTLFVSSQEAHESAHRLEALRKQRAEIRKQRDALATLLDRDPAVLDPTLRRNLQMQHAVLETFAPHLDKLVHRAKRDTWFWRSSQASGALIGAKGVIDMAVTGKLFAAGATTGKVLATTAGVATTATVGGVFTAILPPLTAGAAMAVGGVFTASAASRRRHLHQLEPLIDENLTGTRMSPYGRFILGKIGHRKRFTGDLIAGGAFFTGSAGMALAGAVVGGGLGVALAGPTLGASIPICTTIGAVLGGTGALGAILSVGTLPYGHLKTGRHQAYEQAGRTEEAALLAIADLQRPGLGISLRAQRFSQIRRQFDQLQTFLEHIGEETGEPHVRRTHDVDAKLASTDRPGGKQPRFIGRAITQAFHKRSPAHRRAIGAGAAWMREPKNFPAVMQHMRDVLLIEQEEGNYIDEKIALRRYLFGIKASDLSGEARDTPESADETASKAEVIQKLLSENLKQQTKQDREHAQRIRDFLDNPPQAPPDALRDFIELRTNRKLGAEEDPYRSFAEYCYKIAPKHDRAARGAIFESEVWSAEVAQAAQKAHLRLDHIPSATPTHVSHAVEDAIGKQWTTDWQDKLHHPDEQYERQNDDPPPPTRNR
jgi:hypothetical protein